MKTRSDLSSRLYWFGTVVYGGGGIGWSPWLATRTGPNEPMCSHMLDDPGPPLYMKVTGRLADLPPSTVYAT